MKRNCLLIIIAILVLGSCKKEKVESLDELATRVFSTAVTEYTELAERLPEGKYPRCFHYNKMITSDIHWWCSGFYPGSLWYIYEYTKNDEIFRLAEKYTLGLDKLLEGKTDHDLGFQVNCSYGNALRLTGDSLKYQPMMIAAAEKLASRFNENVGCIKSWDWGHHMGWDYPVIIDNMMNLELLLVAAEMLGEEGSCGEDKDSLALSREYLINVAHTHARTTMEHHFRDDYTCFHVVDYDSNDGHVRKRQTHQGYSDESAWSRGQAWALYGYTMMYDKTGREEYLLQAKNVAKMLFKKLETDCIPLWDFDDPKGIRAHRDASAGAVMASAFVLLSEHTKGHFSRKCRRMAEKQVRALASPAYLVAPGELGGFLLKHSVGNLPGKSEIDRPLTYADYYFLEAVLRLVE